MATDDVSSDSTTNAIVTENAKEPVSLAMDQLVLLGIFSKPAGRSALIRLSNGGIEQVALGDKTQNMTVTALDDNTLYLTAANGKAIALQLPQN